MTPAKSGELTGLVSAVLMLLVVLLVSYYAIILLKVGGAGGNCAKGEGFMNDLYYRPACGGRWAWQNRDMCRGLTTGQMPSIEEYFPISWAPCCGTLDVPPPVGPPV